MSNQTRLLLTLVLATSWCASICGGQSSASGESKPAAAVSAPAGRPKLATFEVARTRREIVLRAGSRLLITNDFGAVKILPGGPKVALETAIYVRGRDAADARKRAAGLSIKAGEKPPAGYSITAVSARDCSQVRADLVLRVPPGTPVTVRSDPGEITIADLHGPVAIHSGAGGVQVTHSGGPLSVDGGAGEVKVDSPRGAVTIDSDSGSVRIADCTAPVVVRTMSGAITLSGMQSENTDASSTSGEITMDVARPFSGRLRARTSTGRISVSLAPGSNCRLRLGTRLGDIRNQLTQTEPSYQGTETEGRLGEGKGMVELYTSLGDIILTSGSGK